MMFWEHSEKFNSILSDFIAAAGKKKFE